MADDRVEFDRADFDAGVPLFSALLQTPPRKRVVRTPTSELWVEASTETPATPRRDENLNVPFATPSRSIDHLAPQMTPTGPSELPVASQDYDSDDGR